MQDAEPVLARTASLRCRPPLPQGPRTPIRAQLGVTSHHSTGSESHSNAARYIFPQPVLSLTAISESAVNSAVSPPPGSPVVTPLPKTTCLTPPPPLSFDVPPFHLKALPLSAAQWTFTSRELQEIVSRAIRLSARESYIRLLSLNALDEQLPRDSQRLQMLQKLTQAKYRFHVQRRTMLLQALNSLSSAANSKPTSPIGGKGELKEPDNFVLKKLVSQLSETTAAMDTLTTDLIAISSHQAQISSLLATHWGSALAVALRKLNTSYARRTRELEDSARRIAMLEAEVTEAWAVADRLAGEMDELEQFAEEIKIPKLKTPERPMTPPRSGLTPLFDFADDNSDLDLARKLAFELTANSATFFLEDESGNKSPAFLRLPHISIARDSSPIARFDPPLSADDFIATSAVTETFDPPIAPYTRDTDAMSTRSAPSISSRRARVSAAKTRSHRASLASLRLPNTGKGSRPGSSMGHVGGLEDEDMPPIPIIMPEALAKITKLKPKLRRRRSTTAVDGRLTPGYRASFISFGSRHESDPGEVEIKFDAEVDVNAEPSLPLELALIPPMWSDEVKDSSSTPSATVDTDPGPYRATHPAFSLSAITHLSFTPSKLFHRTSARTKKTIHKLFRHGSESFLPLRTSRERRSNDAQEDLASDPRPALELIADEGTLDIGSEEAPPSEGTWVVVSDGVGAAASAESVRSAPPATVSEPFPDIVSCISSPTAIPSVAVENVLLSSVPFPSEASSAPPPPQSAAKRFRIGDGSHLLRFKSATKYAMSLPVFGVGG